MARTIAKDYSEKRAHILKTAARVFAEQGFARASMAQIAQECGISKANIYHYYSSKDALLFDILDSYLATLRDRLAAVSGKGTARDRFAALVRETLLSYEGMDHEHQIQTEGLPLLPQEQQEVLKGYQRDMVGRFSTVLEEIAPDVFKSDARKLRAATMSVFGMLNWFYMWNRSADSAAREDYAELVARMTLGGVTSI
ncbi:MAG: TetR/AcrR family transcriptional regulator [Arenibacterium sp.]